MGLRGPGSKSKQARKPRIKAKAVRKRRSRPKSERSVRSLDALPTPKTLPWQRRGLSRAQRVIAFINSLKITSGLFAGKKFVLRSWQEKIIRELYATDRTGHRIKRRALLTLPRKNGKTQLAAALALCHLCGPEAEPRGQIFSAAGDRNQAGLIFREMRAFILADAYLSQRVIIRDHPKTLEDTETGSTYEALSSDARKAHGLSPSFVVCDELAQWPGRELYDNLLSGAGARAEPLVVVISTQSPDPNHVMSELVRYGERVRDGDIEDEAFLPVIFAASVDDDPWSEETWRKCNPALGDFRSLTEFRDAALRAQRIPAQEPSFRNLYLNQPIEQSARFISRADWEACRAEIDVTALYGKTCTLGLDLSSTTDLTALAAYFPEGGELLAWFWAPADTLGEAERRDHVPYALWNRQGLLETTPGRAIDKKFVVTRMLEVAQDFEITACAFDRWGIEMVKRYLEEAGSDIRLEPFGQGFKDMSPAISAVEEMILNGKLKHGGNPLLTMCVANATVVTDPAGGRKLDKAKSIGRIDGLVAATMAIGFAARGRGDEASVYASRGILFV